VAVWAGVYIVLSSGCGAMEVSSSPGVGTGVERAAYDEPRDWAK